MTTFAYDCRHRLIKRTDPHGQVTTYTYDAFNRRTSKTVEGQTTEYLWQGNKLIAETDNQQHWQTFLYEPGSHRPMATIVGSSRVNSPKVRTYWYQNDHLGTPHSLTDSQGNTVWRGQYSAYGQLTEEWTPPDTRDEHPQPKVNNPLRFQGQYEDAESGLYYNLNRYYDPGIGRYLTADPIGLRAGLNNYHYVDSNPISYIDPLGLDVINTKTSTKPEPIGSANGQFSWDKYDDIPVLPEAEVGTYNYRGVHRGHPDADNNFNGRIEPGDINSGITPELHNEGNVSGISPYTSWTRDPAIARFYAQTDGIILRVKAEAPKGNEKWSWEFSDDKYFEQEVLMQGIRDSGIEVFKP